MIFESNIRPSFQENMCRQCVNKVNISVFLFAHKGRGLQFMLRMINQNKPFGGWGYLMFCMFAFQVCPPSRLEEINEIQMNIFLPKADLWNLWSMLVDFLSTQNMHLIAIARPTRLNLGQQTFGFHPDCWKVEIGG